MGKSDIKIRFGADDSELINKLNKMQKTVLGVAKKIQGIGQTMTRNISLPIVAMGAASVGALAKVDKLKKGLEGLMGSAEAANIEFEKLREVAKNPGFNLEAAVAGSLRLQAIGWSADKARGSLEILANSVALVGGTGEDLKGVSVQLSQIISKGKVSAEEINSIAERMPQFRKAMQDAFGTGDSEVLQKMGVSSEEFVDKILLELERLPKAQASVGDTMMNIRDDVMVMAASLGEVLAPVIRKVGKVTQRLAEFMQNLSPPVKKFITILGGILAVAGPIIAAIGGITIAVTAMSAAMSPISLTIVAIIGIIGGLVAAFIYLKANWEAVVDRFKNGWATIYNAFLEANEKVLNLFMKTLRPIYKLLGKDLPKVSLDAYKKAKTTDPKPFGTFGDALKDVLGDFGSLNKEVDKFTGKGDFSTHTKTTYERKGDGPGTGSGGAAKSKGFVSVFEGIQRIAYSYKHTFEKKIPGAIEAMVAKTSPLLDDFGLKVKENIAPEEEIMSTWEKLARALDNILENLGDGWAKHGKAIMQTVEFIDSAFSQFYDNKEARLDNFHEKERARIEGSRSSEEQKNAAIQRLEAQTDKKRRALKRKQAIADKAKAIFDSIIHGAVAVSEHIGSPLAFVVGAAAAANTAFIASQPIPALAKGGLLKGESIVRAGEYQGATFNPEVYSPLDKLKSMLGGMMGDIKIELMPGIKFSTYEMEMSLEGQRVTRGRLTA